MTDQKLQEADELFEAKEYKKEHDILTALLAAEPEVLLFFRFTI